MADSKDKLRPGITETRGASSSPLSGIPWYYLAAGVVVILLVLHKMGKLKFPGKK